MSNDLARLLSQRYPKIFVDREGNWCENQSLDCDDGWFDLIDRLCHCLQSDADSHGGGDYQVTTPYIKEKYGTLRFYAYATQAQHAMIEMAEDLSARICEKCGRPGWTMGPGWYKTLCPEHTPKGAKPAHEAREELNLEDLDKLFRSRYPLIFSGMRSDVRCGAGWFDLIDVLCERLQGDTDHNGHPQVVAVQVKEKFGSLHFYVKGANEEQQAMIGLVEAMSARICEKCGNPGQKVLAGAVMTRCPEHTPEGAISEAEAMERVAARKAKQS